MNINQINNLTGITNIDGKNTNKVDSASFKNMLSNQLTKLEEMEANVNLKQEQYATGELENVQDVLLAMEEFKLTLELTQEVRNKLIDSYTELNRMQL